MKNGLVRLSNTDPEMIRLFVDFLRCGCKISRKDIKAKLILYPDLDKEVSKKYWSRNTQIPLSQFQKTQFIYGKHPTRRLKYGICDVYVCSRGLKEKIFVWLDLFQKELKQYARV